MTQKIAGLITVIFDKSYSSEDIRKLIYNKYRLDIQHISMAVLPTCNAKLVYSSSNEETICQELLKEPGVLQAFQSQSKRPF